jgi:hypothetical protein
MIAPVAVRLVGRTISVRRTRAKTPGEGVYGYGCGHIEWPNARI